MPSLQDILQSLRASRQQPYTGPTWSAGDVMADTVGMVEPGPQKGSLAAALRSGALQTQAGYVGSVPGRMGEALSLSDQASAIGPELPDPFKDPIGALRRTPEVLAQSLPQMSVPLATGLTVGAVATPIAGLIAGAAASYPYFMGQNVIDQAKELKTTDEKLIDRQRASTVAKFQAPLDSLVNLLFPVFKAGPRQAASFLGRLGKGAIAGIVEEAPVEMLQEVGSIINEHPSLKSLFTPEALQRISTAGFYAATAGAPIGSAGQMVGVTPSLNVRPETVEGRRQVQRFFTPGAMRQKANDVVVWTDPEEFAAVEATPKTEADVARIFTELPELTLADDGSGGAVVTGVRNADAISYLRGRELEQVPVRLKMPEGMIRPVSITWGDKVVNLSAERQGKGTATDPVVAKTDADLDIARKRAVKGREPGYVKAFGLDIAIQTPKGQNRRGEGWVSTAPADYGEVRRTEGADGAPLDVWLGPNLDAKTAWVVEQRDPGTGAFDEHKAMLGFDTEAEAIAAYDKAFGDGSGSNRRMSVVQMPMSKFKAWAQQGDLKTRLSTALDEVPATVDDIHEISDQMGWDWDNNPAFMNTVEQMFGKRHLDELKEPELRRLRTVMESLKEQGAAPSALTSPLMVTPESRPSTKLTHLTPTDGRALTAEDYAQELDTHNAIERAILDDEGRDRLARSLGLEDLVQIIGTGWWEGAQNPVTSAQRGVVSTHFDDRKINLMYPDGESVSMDLKTLKPGVRQLINAYASARGLITKQDAVGWNIAHGVSGPNQANGIDIDIGEPIGKANQAKVMKAIEKAGLNKDVVVVPKPNGLRLFVAREINNGKLDFDPQWANSTWDVVKKVLRSNKPTVSWSWVQSGVVDNDWSGYEKVADNGTTSFADLEGARNIREGNYVKTINAVASPESRALLSDILSDVDLAERTAAERRGLKHTSINERIARAVNPNRNLAEAGRNAGPKSRTPTPVSMGGLEPGVPSQKQVYSAFGSIDPRVDTTKDSKLYDLQPLIDRPWLVDAMLDKYGYRVRYFSFEENQERGVDWRPPDLKRDGYKNGTLWLYNPKLDSGSFKDPAYTNAWRVAHELGHALAESILERKYGKSRREGRLGVPGKSYRGAPGKQVEIVTEPLTLREAQRAVEWEDLAFRIQRQLLADMGVTISDSDFAREYNTNISDAVYRSVTGDFGNPGEVGFMPSSRMTDLKLALAMLADAENNIAASQGRPPTKGVDLKRWRQVRDDEVRDLMNREAKNRNKGRAVESEDIGVAPRWRDSLTDIVPGMRSPLLSALNDKKLVQRNIGTPADWKSELLVPTRANKLGLKKNELEWTGFPEWLESQPPDQKLTREDLIYAARDLSPRVIESYMGTPPGLPRKVGELATQDDADTDVVPSGPLLEFDENDHSSTGDLSERYLDTEVDRNIGDELDHDYQTADPGELQEIADDIADWAQGFDAVENDILDDDFEFASVENSADIKSLEDVLSPLGLSLQDFIKQMELPGMESTAAERLDRAKEMANQMLRQAFGAAPKNRAGYPKGDAWNNIFRDEDVKSLLDDDTDNRLREAYDEKNRPEAERRLRESISEDEDYKPRIWTYRHDGVDYEIREVDHNGSGRYETYVDDEETGTHRSFQAAVDSLEGSARASAAGDEEVEYDPQTMPKQSEYLGRARWQNYGGKPIPGARNYREINIRVPNLEKKFTHGHFRDLENQVIHVRAEDIPLGEMGTGYFLKERQSDLYSNGLQEGFFDPEKDAERKARIKYIQKELPRLEAEANEIAVAALIPAMMKDPEFSKMLHEAKKKAYKGFVGGLIPSDDELVEKMSRVDDSVDEAFASFISHAANAITGIDGHIPVTAMYQVFGNEFGSDLLPAHGSDRWRSVTTSLSKTFRRPEFAASIKEAVAKRRTLKDEAAALMKEQRAEQSYGSIPKSPWMGQWDEFILKHQLKFAAERGYGALAWPTGNMQSVIEGWGTGANVINSDQYKSRAAIMDRNDYGAPQFLSDELKKKDPSVKPILMQVSSGGSYPVPGVERIEVKYDPRAKSVTDKGGDVVVVLPGELRSMERKAAKAWWKAYEEKNGNVTDDALLDMADIEGVANYGTFRGDAERDKLKLDLYLALSKKRDADGNAPKDIKPTSVTLLVQRQMGPNNTVSIRALGDKMFWVLPITDKLRNEILEKGFSGYWRGGLVRAA